MIETGYELLDAIINNPIQAIILLGIIYIGFKFFFGCQGFFAEQRSKIKWEINYWLDHDLIDWLEERDRKYSLWLKKRTKKQMLGFELAVWTGFMGSFSIWSFFAIEQTIMTQLLSILIIIESVGFSFVAIYRYYHPKVMQQSNMGAVN